MRGTTRFAAGCFALALALPFVAGCGGSGSSKPKVSVHGEVKLDGEPLENGSITFTGLDAGGKTAGGNVIDGKYTVDDVYPGKNKITVTSAGSMKGGQQMDMAKMNINPMDMYRQAQGSGGKGMEKKVMKKMGMGGQIVDDKTVGNNQTREITNNKEEVNVTLTSAKK